MADKNDVLKKMDGEIADFFRSMGTKPDKVAVDKLQHYTLIRHELENIPLNPPQINTMCQCDSMLKVADEYSSYLKTKASPDYTQLAHFFIDNIYFETRVKLLWNRISKENENYHERILTLPPKDIIDSAYEIATKNDIVLSIENIPLSTQQIDALLTIDHPLDAIYQEWMDSDASYMEMLNDSVECLIADQIKVLQQRENRTAGETPSEDIQVWDTMYDAIAEDEENLSECELGEDDEGLEQ